MNNFWRTLMIGAAAMLWGPFIWISIIKGVNPTGVLSDGDRTFIEIVSGLATFTLLAGLAPWSRGRGARGKDDDDYGGPHEA